MILQKWALLEHSLGIMPLLLEFFGTDHSVVVDAQNRPAVLGFFTPAVEHGWAASALGSEICEGGLRLQGSIRIPTAAAVCMLVLVRTPAALRLAWIDCMQPGVMRRPSQSAGPCWFDFDGVVVAEEGLSRPIPMSEAGDLQRHLENYASAWAPLAADCACVGLKALRRAVRTAGLQHSQVIAFEITKFEIEAHLAAAAARPGGAEPFRSAAAAARALNSAVALMARMESAYGFEISSPLADISSKGLTAFLGGPAWLASEVARSLIPAEVPYRCLAEERP